MLSKYFAALFEKWEGKMSGIVSLCLTALATYSTFLAGDKGIGRARIYLWVAAALCFLYANYAAWHQQHLRNLALEKQLLDSRPKFQLEIGYSLWDYDQVEGITVFFVMAQLLNFGAPSVALMWSAKYSIGASVEDMTSYYLLSPYTLMDGPQKLTITNGDLLNVKTHETQVPKGGRVGGRLLFTLPGDRRVQLASANFRIDVTCYDYLETPASAAYSPHTRPIKGGILHLPTENVELLPAPASQKGAAALPPLKEDKA